MLRERARVQVLLSTALEHSEWTMHSRNSDTLLHTYMSRCCSTRALHTRTCTRTFLVLEARAQYTHALAHAHFEFWKHALSTHTHLHTRIAYVGFHPLITNRRSTLQLHIWLWHRSYSACLIHINERTHTTHTDTPEQSHIYLTTNSTHHINIYSVTA